MKKFLFDWPPVSIELLDGVKHYKDNCEHADFDLLPRQGKEKNSGKSQKKETENFD